MTVVLPGYEISSEMNVRSLDYDKFESNLFMKSCFTMLFRNARFSNSLFLNQRWCKPNPESFGVIAVLEGKIKSKMASRQEFKVIKNVYARLRL